MSIAFRMLLAVREKLYKSQILQPKKLQHPVISIGNLTVGGTGKTPLVIALASRMRDEGFRPVVLSRGYKRTSSGIVVVSRGAGPLVNAEAAGDEPYLIARRAGQVAVVVGADRYEAGTVAEREGLGDLFILDDGFQHRRLHRTVDIVTIDPVEWDAGERLLPAGRWREPKSSIERAHAACIQERAGIDRPTLAIPAFAVRMGIDGIFDGDELVPLQSIQGRAIAAFAGIAKPERFFETLEALGVRPMQKERFRDHHNYSEQDLKKLRGELLITTEKDAVRLESRAIAGFLHLRVSVKIPELDGLVALIRRRISEAA